MATYLFVSCTFGGGYHAAASATMEGHELFYDAQVANMVSRLAAELVQQTGYRGNCTILAVAIEAANNKKRNYSSSCYPLVPISEVNELVITNTDGNQWRKVR